MDDSRHVRLGQLGADQAVVMSAVMVKPNSRAERRYGIGLNRHDDEYSRLYFFVATGAAPYPNEDAGTNDHVIAHYAVYSFTNNDSTTLEPVAAEGDITKCRNKHRQNEAYSGHFIPCSKAESFAALAKENSLSMSTVLNLASCSEAGSLFSGTMLDSDFCRGTVNSVLFVDKSVARADSAQTSKLARFMHQLRRLVAMEDFTLDPYWFSCAAGCCTAGT